MTTVFVGGSRHVSRLNANVRARLDNIIAKAFPVLVGDANGADKAVQQYLHSQHYQNVSVFCVGGFCRNNVGHWQQRDIQSESRIRDAQFFSTKDRVMAEEATVGLMIWDGKSIGTLLNVYRLLGLGKNAVVYNVPEKRFIEFKRRSQWDEFMAECDSGLRHKVEQRAALEQPVSATRHAPAQASLHI
jgi:hypothetical protein